VVSTQAHLIKPVSRFQRAIHVRYDLQDPEIIAQYIPTQTTANTIGAILRNTQKQATQRAHVLHAAYGSGKSHLAVALAALFEQDDTLTESVEAFVNQLRFTDTHVGELAQDYVDENIRLFPVILTGNEGDFETSILRALVRSLKQAELSEVQLRTRFDAALETINRWRIEYPEVATRFENVLREQHDQQIGKFETALGQHNEDSYRTFSILYSEITAGATFDPFTEQSAEIVYRDVAAQIKQQGYTGIVVIWDEFGRYLEGHASQAFGNEAAMLQDFAETCNHSADDEQIHLLLITHKELQGYASTLPQSYQQEWSRIEGRFQRHNITTDPAVAYRLIAAAIQQTDDNLIHHFQDEETIDWNVDWARDFHLFGMLPRDDIRELIRSTFPLHPLTTFALAHVSSRVAQNERTMFTFLTSDEPHSLSHLLAEKMNNGKRDNPVIYVSDLWDYFEDAIRADIGGAGAHKHWGGVVHALDKVATDDDFGKQIVKALGILTICADVTPLRPTSDVLAWAVGARDDDGRADVVTTLDYLRRRKAIIHRQIDGYWTFIAGSDINFEQELQRVLEQSNPTPTQLRTTLEHYMPAPDTLARRYNQEYSMTRYFTGLYRWTHEIKDAPWDLQISKSNTDGLVVYVLATDDVEWQDAFEYIQTNEQVVYVLPRRNQQILLSLQDTLRELFALQEINDDPKLRQHDDNERIQREINWLQEDAEGRLAQIVSNLTDPRRDNAVWVKVKDEQAYFYDINSPGQATKIVSDICQHIFPATPAINSEGLNRNKPTSQQSRAAQTVIDAMFARQPSRTFGIEGRGPDVLALNSVLKLSGVLRLVDAENDVWEFGRPTQDEQLAQIWDIISEYLDDASEQTSLQPLFDTLTQPPYGLRLGIIPLLFAAVLRERLKVTTVWKGRNAVGAVTSDTIYNIINKPDEYSIKVGEWNTTFDNIWHSLLDLFDAYILETERDQQPLAMVSIAMLRWLQASPAFCRDTRQISERAIEFRGVIRKGIREPAKALFESLPDVLEIEASASQDEVRHIIEALMQEISNAYLDLQRRLDMFVAQSFGVKGLSQDALVTLKSWLATVSTGDAHTIEEFKFGSLITQDFVDVVLNTEADDSQFWNKLSVALVGVTLRDWNDESESRFRERLIAAREEIERDVQDLIEGDKAITFSIEMPETGKQDFRFRASDLSSQGQRILQNFKSTMQVAGRPLSIDEKRKVALAFIIHIMGDDSD
jgi:hypothetical protein